jgi:hypothetical protein
MSLIKLRSGALLTMALWAVFLAGTKVVVVPPESCGETAPAAIRLAAEEAAGWMKANGKPDGTYLYMYLADTDTVPQEYNEVRHAGVTMSLYQAAGRLEDPEALAVADRALVWMEDHLVRRRGWAALDWPGGRPKLGATALMTAALAERRVATGGTAYDGLMRELGRFMVALQREDGGFRNGWDLGSDEPLPGTSKYYPGEAFWALLLLEKAFPGEGWLDSARSAATWLVTERDEELDVDFPPLADQWTAYGLADLADYGLTAAEADYARRLAERWGFFTRGESQREGGWVGRAVRGPPARASGMGTWVEGLTALWRVSMKDDRLAGLQSRIKDRALCASGILTARQVGEQEAETYPRPEYVRGAWVRTGETRMDDQQHAFSGLIYTLDVLEGRLQRTPAEPVLPP